MVLAKDRLIKSMVAEPASSQLSDGFKLNIEVNNEVKQQP